MKELSTLSIKHTGSRAATSVPVAQDRPRRSEPRATTWRSRQVLERPFKAFARRLRQPRVLITLGILAVITLSVGFFFWTKLSREIDGRLKRAFLDDSIGIFTSPFKVSIGDRLAGDEISSYLIAAGYQRREDGSSKSAGSFSVEEKSIEIIPRGGMGLVPLRMEINGGRVAALENLQTGAKLKNANIEGELLAAVEGDDRRKRIMVSFDDIPQSLKNAIVAIEDRRFFSHMGVNWRGVARAMWADIDQGGIVQGGSTITQQLIKNAFLTNDRNFRRKIKEAAMAIVLESKLTKEEIFAHYCNEVYLGQMGTFAINGFAQAAQVYFGKRLDQLTLAESAYLAGLIHAPNRYGLHRDTAAGAERRNVVLDAMVETEALTSEEAEAAKREPLVLKKREVVNDYGSSYFVDYAQSFLEERYGASGMAIRRGVYTTMDPRLQRTAHEAVNKHAERVNKLLSGSKKKADGRKVQAALVALDAHTGEVLAMVGGRSYGESQLNRATDALRQPGSTFKPFVYASALGMRSYTAATKILDSERSFTFDGGRREYKPTNYGGGYTNSEVTLREAFARSLNVPTVDVAMRVGLGTIADLAEDCGLADQKVYPSMALGTTEVTPLQLAAAYTAFANNGMALKPVPVRQIARADLEGGAESVLATSTRVFSPQVAYLMTSMMRTVVNSGTASKLHSMGAKGAIAGKTGTSNDGWFAAYTPNMVCVVWVGYDDNTDLGLKASETAMPLWADFVKEAVEIRSDLGGDDFTKPGGIITAEIDPDTGLLATDGCGSRRQEVFISGTEPYATCTHGFSDDYLFTADYESPLYPADEDDTDSSKLSSSSNVVSEVMIEVCSQTGRIASAYCDDTTKRAFKLGSEPVGVCFGEGHRNKAKTYTDTARSMNEVPDSLSSFEPPKRKGAKAEASKKPLKRNEDN